MAIALKYKVRNVYVEAVTIEVMVGGKPTSAAVERLIVEVDQEGGKTAQQLGLPVVSGDEFAAQREAFVIGAEFEVTVGLPAKVVKPVAAPVPAPRLAPPVVDANKAV